MIDKETIWLLIIAGLAFMCGALCEAGWRAFSKDSKGFIEGLVAEFRWARDESGRSVRRVGAWALRTFDQYAPVLKTRTGAASTVQKAATLAALFFPSLPISDQNIERAIWVVICAVAVLSWLRTLYGRRHAFDRGRLDVRGEGAGAMGAGAAADLNERHAQ